MTIILSLLRKYWYIALIGISGLGNYALYDRLTIANLKAVNCKEKLDILESESKTYNNKVEIAENQAILTAKKSQSDISAIMQSNISNKCDSAMLWMKNEAMKS